MNKKQTPKRHTAVPKAPTPVVASVIAPAEKTTAAKTPVAAAAVVAAAPVITAAPVVATPVKPAAAAAAAPVELIAALRSPSAEAAVDAAAALAKTGDARCVEPLLLAMANADGYCHVVTRAAAAMALAAFQEPRVIAALTAATRDPMAEVSREAVLALGALNAAAAAPALIAIAENVDGYYAGTVRHAAVRTLGRLKAKAAQPLLARIALTASEDASLVSAARDALGQM